MDVKVFFVDETHAYAKLGLVFYLLLLFFYFSSERVEKTARAGGIKLLAGQQ